MAKSKFQQQIHWIISQVNCNILFSKMSNQYSIELNDILIEIWTNRNHISICVR